MSTAASRLARRALRLGSFIFHGIGLAFDTVELILDDYTRPRPAPVSSSQRDEHITPVALTKQAASMLATGGHVHTAGEVEADAAAVLEGSAAWRRLHGERC